MRRAASEQWSFCETGARKKNSSAPAVTMHPNGNDLSGLVEPRHRWREEGGSPPLSLSLIPDRSRPPRRGPGEAYPEGPALSRQRRARAHTQRRCPLTPRTAHHTPLVAVLQSAARARCTGPTCGRRHVRRGSPRGSAPTTSNAPPWHRGADDQAQRMTPGKRSRASTIAAGAAEECAGAGGGTSGSSGVGGGAAQRRGKGKKKSGKGKRSW